MSEILDINKKKLPKLAIVVPCYNEETIIDKTIDELLGILNEIKSKSYITKDSFIVFVDDGSTDNTWNHIQEKHFKNIIIKGLKLSSNVGHQNALLSGLLRVKDQADCVISIDADLQDDITAIEKMVLKFIDGFEVVYGVRNKRSSDTLFKRYTALVFYKILNLLGINCIYNHADFRLLSRRVLQELSTFREVNLFLRGLIPLIGFKTTNVYYTRKAREAGESKYPLIKMISFALEGITSFSVVPLRLVTLIGVMILLASFLLSLWIIISKLLGNVIPGWTSIVLPIYIIGGIQIMCIGILGEYIGKTYREVKARPRYIYERELF